MFPTTPTVPVQSNVIRTYPTIYAEPYETSESDATENEASEIEEERGLNEEQRLTSNQSFMDDQILQNKPIPWSLLQTDNLTTDGAPVILIEKPTASQLKHQLLNPYIYMNLKKIDTLNDLASLLDTPSDWEDTYQQKIATNADVIGHLNRLRSLPDGTTENIIQIKFEYLVIRIAFILGIRLGLDSETNIIVGGILAKYEFDLRSRTDPNFYKEFTFTPGSISDTTIKSGIHLIGSEVKTESTFPLGHVWYHKSRGVQVLASMYAFNAPTFLLTQKHWKIFVENEQRNDVFTFPFGNDTEADRRNNSCEMMPIGSDFLKAIVICLLTERTGYDEPIPDDEPIQINTTPEKRNPSLKKQYSTTPAGNLSEKEKDSTNLNISSLKTMKTPSFVSGYIDGNPVYSTVRVMSREDVSRIENEISIREKNESFPLGSSEMTL